MTEEKSNKVVCSITLQTTILEISKKRLKRLMKNGRFGARGARTRKAGKPPPPKRKVVGSNPARNANLEGGDRKNRFPLLLSHKTISV